MPLRWMTGGMRGGGGEEEIAVRMHLSRIVLHKRKNAYSIILPL